MIRKTDPQVRGLVRFGAFEADLEAGELYRSGVRVRLQGQPFRVLAILLEHAGEVVSRAALQRELWGTDTTVDFDHSLGIAVNKLREALGDSAESPRFVETLARRGYRFIAPVNVPFGAPARAPVMSPVGDAAGEQQASASPATVPPGPARAAWRLLGLPLALSIAAAAGALLRPPGRLPYPVRQVTSSGHVLAESMDVERFPAMVSDGTRIYLSSTENGGPVLAVVLAANGETSIFHLPAEIGEPLICALSPDGSRLLVRGHLEASPEQALWIVPTLGGDAQRVPGVLAHDATWMPEGRRLLVASGDELTVMNADGSSPARLLSTPGPAFWLRWSPDGSRLRFTLRDPVRQTSALWEAGADGSRPHPMLEGWSQPASECCGSWTGDGRYFVFQSAKSGEPEIWAWQERPWWRGGRSRPWPVTGGPLDYEAPGGAPSGGRIYFTGATSTIQLLRAEPRSSRFTSVAPGLSAAALAAFSPDGRWVAWVNAADNSLWRSRADGTDRILLAAPPLRIFSMRWSPDDRRLAVMAREPGGPWKIYLIDADGGRAVPILDEDRNEADPSWSPDGGSILFGRPPDRMDNLQPKAIYRLDLGTRRVTGIPGSTGLFSPRLSPDGRYIAAMPLDQRSLRLLDLRTGRWSTLTAHAAGDPAFSRDGRHLYFQDFLEPGRPLYRIAIPGGRIERVATIESLMPIAATEYRLIGLAPGDLPMVTARTTAVDAYSTSLTAPE